jgi:hypothetical protein
MPNENDPPRDRPWERGDNRDRDDDYDDRPRRRPRDDEDDYDERPRRRDDFGRRAEPSNGLATAGLVLGLIALCTGPLAGLPAMICGGIALTRPGGRGAAIAGLVLGLFGCALPLLLIPAVWKVREAASRTKDQNNMKQIVLGAHNYHDATGRLPEAQGKLSWRVHLLPYVEQSGLYMQFKQDEPWDSPANKRLAREPVQQYISAGDPPGTVETRYRVFVGPGTLFPPGQKPLKIPDITDGLSSTFFAVEATETVPWPQPKELPYERGGPLPALGTPHRNGFIVAMMDGSVRFVSDGVSPEVIRGGIEPADNRFFKPE